MEPKLELNKIKAIVKNGSKYIFWDKIENIYYDTFGYYSTLVEARENKYNWTFNIDCIGDDCIADDDTGMAYEITIKNKKRITITNSFIVKVIVKRNLLLQV